MWVAAHDGHICSIFQPRIGCRNEENGSAHKLARRLEISAEIANFTRRLQYKYIITYSMQMTEFAGHLRALAWFDLGHPRCLNLKVISPNQTASTQSGE